MKSKNKENQNKEQKCEKVFVEGMHCASCKVLIEKEFSRFKGVKEVNADVSNGIVELELEKGTELNTNDLNKSVKEYGYTVLEVNKKGNKKTKRNFKNYIIPLLLALLFAFVFDYLGKRTPIGLSDINDASSYPSYFLFGLIAGISSCAAVIGGLLLGASKKWSVKYGKSLKPQILFLTSRTLTFFLLGGFLGIVGMAFSMSQNLSTFLILLVSLFMVFIGLQMIEILPSSGLPSIPGISKFLNKIESKNDKSVPVLLGAMTFFIPCGFTLIAQANALTMASFWQAALSMLAFALGTLPPLLAVTLASNKFYTNKKFETQFSYFAGFLIIILGLISLNSHLNLLGLPSFNDVTRAFTPKTVAESNIVGGTQLMQMEAKGFAYMPQEFNLAVDVPVRWEIYNSGALGCANAVYAPGLYEEVVVLKPGLNVVEFTPTKKGNYKISCSMGMVPPVYVSVN